MDRKTAMKLLWGIMIALVPAGSAFAQNSKQNSANNANVTRSSRKEIEAYAATNKTYARA
jgi:hypothetical protein